MKIEIYQNPETDLFDLSVTGCTDYDDLNDLTEQDANDEAEAIQAETNAPIVRT